MSPSPPPQGVGNAADAVLPAAALTAHQAKQCIFPCATVPELLANVCQRGEKASSVGDGGDRR